MHSAAVGAVAGHQLKRAVGDRLAGLVADDLVAALGALTFPGVGGGTTPAVRSLLVSSRHAVDHIADRPVLHGGNGYVLSIGLRCSVR